MFAFPDWSTKQYLFAAALVAIPMLPNLWSIYHAFTRFFETREEKKLWILVAVFVPVIGGLAYIFVGRKRARNMQQIVDLTSGQTPDQAPDQAPDQTPEKSPEP